MNQIFTDIYYWSCLSWYQQQYVIIPESVKTKSSPPLHAVKNLRVEFRLSGLKSPVEVVESLLWLAPCPESISISRDDCSGCKSIKVLLTTNMHLLCSFPLVTGSFASVSFCVMVSVSFLFEQLFTAKIHV